MIVSPAQPLLRRKVAPVYCVSWSHQTPVGLRALSQYVFMDATHNDQISELHMQSILLPLHSIDYPRMWDDYHCVWTLYRKGSTLSADKVAVPMSQRVRDIIL